MAAVAFPCGAVVYLCGFGGFLVGLLVRLQLMVARRSSIASWRE
jgi:hypothetical protein